MSVGLLGESWALVRLPEPDGTTRLAAFADQCPHRLAPLSAGQVDGNRLRSAYHGWCFDADGTCTEIPSLAVADRVPRRACPARVPASLTEQAGLIFLAPERPLTDLLDVSTASDPTFMHGMLEPSRARVGAGLMIDNFLDLAHFPFVHRATIGAEEAPVVGDLDIERDGFAMTVRNRHWFPNHEDLGVVTGERSLLQERSLVYEYRAPFAVSLRIDYVQAGGTMMLHFFVQPEDDEQCRIYTLVHRDDLGGDPHLMAESLAFEAKILDEDLGPRSAMSTTTCRSIRPPRSTSGPTGTPWSTGASCPTSSRRPLPFPRDPCGQRALFVLCLALTVVVIDNTILAVAFPSIQRGLGADEVGPAVDRERVRPGARGAAVPLAVIGDRHGRKRMLTIGMTIFGVASVAAAFADFGHCARGRPGHDGCRWRVRDAGHALHDRQRLSRRGTRAGDRSVVRRRGHRDRGRAGARRPAARALLVGLGVPRERAGRDRHARARGVVGSSSRDPESPKVDVRSALSGGARSPRRSCAVIEGPRPRLALTDGARCGIARGAPARRLSARRGPVRRSAHRARRRAATRVSCGRGRPCRRCSSRCLARSS